MFVTIAISVDVLEIGRFADFAERYSRDWQRIAESSPFATVFQSWEWMQTWWEHRSFGKRARILVFTNDGETVGFAPLFQGAFPQPLRSIRFVGTGGSDYLDILAAPGQEASVSESFLSYLSTNRRTWDWIDLQQVRPESVAANLLTQAVPTNGVRVASWRGETCPFVTLPDSYDAFHRGLNKKLRQNVGYYTRALEKAYIVEVRMATEDTLADDLEAFFFLHQRRWNQRWMPGAFASRRERSFHETAAARLLASDMLRLHTLSLDGEVQAALYCFQKGRRCYYYLGGFEPKYAKLSLGTVLTAHAIRHAIEVDRADEFDFLRGDEGYKYKWGARDRYNLRLSIERPGVRPALLTQFGRAAFMAEQSLKGFMHRRHGAAGGGSPTTRGTLNNAKGKGGDAAAAAADA